MGKRPRVKIKKSEKVPKEVVRTIEIEKDVDVSIDNRTVKVKGSKGEIEKEFNDPRYNEDVSFETNDGKFIVKSVTDRRKYKALVGTIEGHVKNMIIGVTKGYKYELNIVTAHFPVTVTVEENRVHIKNFLGEKGARKAKIRGDCKIKSSKDSVVVSGINLEDVSQTSANIEQSCRVTGKDRRVFIDGIYITKKETEDGEKI